jgi:hypothetical protein
MARAQTASTKAAVAAAPTAVRQARRLRRPSSRARRTRTLVLPAEMAAKGATAAAMAKLAARQLRRPRQPYLGLRRASFRRQIEIAGVFKGFYPRNFSFVCAPVHALGPWWKFAGGVCVVRAPEPISNGLRRTRATGPALELGAIRHPPAPCFSGADRNSAAAKAFGVGLPGVPLRLTSLTALTCHPRKPAGE